MKLAEAPWEKIEPCTIAFIFGWKYNVGGH